MTRAHVGVTALLSIIVGWFVFDGVSSLMGLPALYAQLGVADQVPWVALWLGVLHPVVYFVAAIMVGRRMALTRFTLVLIVALAASAATRLTIIALATGSILLV
jgi:hypothetical protein